MRRRRFVSLVAGASLIVALAGPAVVSPASAKTYIYHCTFGGEIVVSGNTTTFAGQGSCIDSSLFFWPMTFSATGGRGTKLICSPTRPSVAVVRVPALNATLNLEHPFGSFHRIIKQKWTQIGNLTGAPVYNALVRAPSGGLNGVLNGVSLSAKPCPSGNRATTQGPFALAFFTHGVHDIPEP